MRPIDAVIAVTYRCNARCAMCGIWQSVPTGELSPEAYLKLPGSLRDVNLTGGEPFLRDDLDEVHCAVRRACPRARTVISTNGILTDRILRTANAMARNEPGIGVAVSIDGPADVHDRLRGVKGAFDCAMATLRALKEAGFRNLKVAFTATRENVQALRATYDMACSLGVEFTCAIQHGSYHYFHVPTPVERLPEDKLREQLEPVIVAELRKLSPKRWARAYFMQGMLDFATGRGRPLHCRAGRDFFFMDPAGDIYTCNAAPFRMGNLAEQNFEEIISSQQAQEACQKADRCMGGCWMICTARTAIRRAWPKVLAWAIAYRLGISKRRTDQR